MNEKENVQSSRKFPLPPRLPFPLPLHTSERCRILVGGKLVDGGPGELEILEILIRKIKQRNVEPDQTREGEKAQRTFHYEK